MYSHLASLSLKYSVQVQVFLDADLNFENLITFITLKIIKLTFISQTDSQNAFMSIGSDYCIALFTGLSKPITPVLNNNEFYCFIYSAFQKNSNTLQRGSNGEKY